MASEKFEYSCTECFLCSFLSLNIQFPFTEIIWKIQYNQYIIQRFSFCVPQKNVKQTMFPTKKKKGWQNIIYW